jgi:hypothetical protein
MQSLSFILLQTSNSSPMLLSNKFFWRKKMFWTFYIELKRSSSSFLGRVEKRFPSPFFSASFSRSPKTSSSGNLLRIEIYFFLLSLFAKAKANREESIAGNFVYLSLVFIVNKDRFQFVQEQLKKHLGKSK